MTARTTAMAFEAGAASAGPATGPGEVPPAIARRRARLAELRAERGRRLGFLEDRFPGRRRQVDELAGRIRRVAFVLGSPRGGTSAFKDTLAAHHAVLASPGEHRPLLTLFGLNYPDHGGPDEGGVEGTMSPAIGAALLRQFLHDCQAGDAPEPSPREVEFYAWQWALRLPLQWPDLAIDAEPIVRAVTETCHRHRGLIAGDPDGFRLELVRSFRSIAPAIDPWMYHLDPPRIRDAFPGTAPPAGPPSSLILEIAPYLLPLPQQLAFASGREGPRVLLLKASSDGYRLPLLAEWFRGWDRTDLHLVRNPLAAVNGLLDGWGHPAYWQHDLRGSAEADCLRGLPGGDGDRLPWKFDLHEDWRDDGDRSLVATCARQWASPHERILARIAPGERRDRLRFEDFQRGEDARRGLLERACEAMGIFPDEAMGRRLARPRVVNATHPPSAGRWRDRGGAWGAALLARDDVRSLCRAFGDDPEDAAHWP